ncbi:hypothetical protein C9F11_18310 [Streptomyces sp. YIM 121038]|nr:hypothetical protein C9F11_18310 [Streptomyces sp. YIM 121038]
MDTICPQGAARPATPRAGPVPGRPGSRWRGAEKGRFERGAGPVR